MGRPTRTSEQLADIEFHLRYEFWMLKKATDVLGSAAISGESLPAHIENALLESFAIHARCLLDFFYPPASAKQDDALAEDFYPEWNRVRPPEPPEPLGVIPDRVGKEIAHLTYRRIAITDEARNWNYGSIWLALRELLTAFANNAPPDGPINAEFKRRASEDLGIPIVEARRFETLGQNHAFAAATQGIGR